MIGRLALILFLTLALLGILCALLYFMCGPPAWH
jgi:hypothetical protein